MSLHLSKYHIVGNHMSRLICFYARKFFKHVDLLIVAIGTASTNSAKIPLNQTTDVYRGSTLIT